MRTGNEKRAEQLRGEMTAITMVIGVQYLAIVSASVMLARAFFSPTPEWLVLLLIVVFLVSFGTLLFTAARVAMLSRLLRPLEHRTVIVTPIEAPEPPQARIEASDGLQMLLGTITPEKGTWGKMGDTLHKNRWNWSRNILAQDGGYFIRLTERYPEITKDMLRIEFISNGGKDGAYKVTDKGKEFFIHESSTLIYPDSL